MEQWGLRIFKTISKFKVYHFSSITTRKRDIILNNGTKTFLLKYGFNPRFFRKYYLRGDGLRPFDGKLQDPKFNLIMLLEYLINKLKYFYFNIKMTKCIVRIAEGIGNQLLCSQIVYPFSRRIGYSLYIDNKSAYFQKKY